MGWCSRLAAWPRRAAVLAAAAGIAALSLGPAPLAAAAPWPASGGPGSGGTGGTGDMGVNGGIGLVPALSLKGKQSSYFQLAIDPGGAVTAVVAVSNLSSRTQTLTLSRAVGVTATGGGSAYRPVTGRCRGTACWVTGLPRGGITLLGGGYTGQVSFTVRVPRGTPPGQYLSGITAQRATHSAPVALGSNGGAGTKAVVIRLVTVGVAVTVGNLSSLVSRLSIRGVRGTTVGQVARLNVSMYNTGQTFAKGKGKISCRAAGQWHSYTVYANTVLPRDHTVIAVNAPASRMARPCPAPSRSGTARNRLPDGPAPSPSPAARARTTNPSARAPMPWLPRPGFPAGPSR